MSGKTTTVDDLFPLAVRFQEMRAELLRGGYRDVEHPTLRPGRRVRGRAEQYPEAFDNGTGVILVVMEKPDSAWSRSWGGPDIELIVLRDREQFGLRLSQLANYHVAAVTTHQ